MKIEIFNPGTPIGVIDSYCHLNNMAVDPRGQKPQYRGPVPQVVYVSRASQYNVGQPGKGC